MSSHSWSYLRARFIMPGRGTDFIIETKYKQWKYNILLDKIDEIKEALGRRWYFFEPYFVCMNDNYGDAKPEKIENIRKFVSNWFRDTYPCHSSFEKDQRGCTYRKR